MSTPWDKAINTLTARAAAASRAARECREDRMPAAAWPFEDRAGAYRDAVQIVSRYRREAADLAHSTFADAGVQSPPVVESPNEPPVPRAWITAVIGELEREVEARMAEQELLERIVQRLNRALMGGATTTHDTED